MEAGVENEGRREFVSDRCGGNSLSNNNEKIIIIIITTLLSAPLL